jgi:hypothetical protein
MSEEFRYTDEQWAKIARELPEGADHEHVRWYIEGNDFTDGQMAEIVREWWPEGTDPEHVMSVAERSRAVTRWNASNPKMARRKQLRLLKDVSAAARKLRAALDTLDKSELDEDDDVWEGAFDLLFSPEFPVEIPSWPIFDWKGFFLKCLMSMAQDADAKFVKTSRRGRAAYIYRNGALWRLLVAWVCAGGVVRASGMGNGAKDGGPLVRYLIAASKPLNVQPALTVNSARDFVRAKRSGGNLDLPEGAKDCMTMAARERGKQ